MLICTFASPRSRPEKIHRWIGYLEELRYKHADDEQAVEMVDRLLSRARGWARNRVA